MSQTLIICETCRNPQCYCTCKNAPPSVPVQAVVRPWCEPTSRGYDVSGPDKDGDMCIEFDVDTNIIWLARRDVEMLLARWPNVQVEFQEGSE